MQTSGSAQLCWVSDDHFWEVCRWQMGPLGGVSCRDAVIWWRRFTLRQPREPHTTSALSKMQSPLAAGDLKADTRPGHTTAGRAFSLQASVLLPCVLHPSQAAKEGARLPCRGLQWICR